MRACTHAKGTPSTMAIDVALSEQTRESLSASIDAGARTSATACGHGALMTRPSSGRTKSAAPHSASSAISAGGRSPPFFGICLGFRETVAGEYGLAGCAQEEVDEGLATPGVGAALDGCDRVGRDHVLVVRDVDPLHLRPCRLDIGDVDDPRVRLTGRHLGDHGVHVLLL